MGNGFPLLCVTFVNKESLCGQTWLTSWRSSSSPHTEEDSFSLSLYLSTSLLSNWNGNVYMGKSVTTKSVAVLHLLQEYQTNLRTMLLCWYSLQYSWCFINNEWTKTKKWNRQMYSTNQTLTMMENFILPSICSVTSMHPHPLLSPTAELVDI